MKQHQRPNRGKSSHWLTPRWILDPLGTFDLDPCCPPKMPWDTATIMANENSVDGLALSWRGSRVWLNPPFGKGEREPWMKKMAEHGNGIMLIPAATETKAFRLYVWNAASAILFLDRRPHFCRPDGLEADANSGCSICLVAYGDDRGLQRSGLPGFLVDLWRNNAPEK